MNDFQLRIGVGEPSRAFGRLHGTSRRRNVVREEGPRAGTSAGFHVDHWDGRVDATVRPDVVRQTIPKKEGA